MLQQILKDMRVEPELLAELSEEQKQILFVKMREEQIRRYYVFETGLKPQEPEVVKKPNKNGCHVGFLEGADGREWVWLLGDEENDNITNGNSSSTSGLDNEKRSSVSQVKMLANIFSQSSNTPPARSQSPQLGKRPSATGPPVISLKPTMSPPVVPSTTPASSSVSIPRPLTSTASSTIPSMASTAASTIPSMTSTAASTTPSMTPSVPSSVVPPPLILSDTSALSPPPDSPSVPQAEAEVEKAWREAEEKAKKAEVQRRKLARRAREEHRKSLLMDGQDRLSMAFDELDIKKDRTISAPLIADPCPLALPTYPHRTPRPLRPNSKRSIIDWFRSEELPRGACLDPITGGIQPWFHGIINRFDAESLLQSSPIHSFLVRVSERIWGYTVSYRPANNLPIKHFLVEIIGVESNYRFFGTSLHNFISLSAMIKHYATNPISPIGQEYLLHPVGQARDIPDYQDILTNEDNFSTNL